MTELGLLGVGSHFELWLNNIFNGIWTINNVEGSRNTNICKYNTFLTDSSFLQATLYIGAEAHFVRLVTPLRFCTDKGSTTSHL